MREKIYTPLNNLFLNFEETFYIRNPSGHIQNWDDILSGDHKNPYNKFKSLSESFFQNFRIINDVIVERVLENRSNLGRDRKAFMKLKVDLITLFLMIRIQMDKIAELTTYFYNDRAITGKKRESFRKQKNWWLAENGTREDIKFSDIIKSKTIWFDDLVDENGLRDGIVHKHMNIYVDTENYEISGAVIKKKKGNLSVGKTEEILVEVAKIIGGFYEFCRIYEKFFLKKTKGSYEFEDRNYWYDGRNIREILKNTKKEHLLKPINYNFMK